MFVFAPEVIEQKNRHTIQRLHTVLGVLREKGAGFCFTDSRKLFSPKQLLVRSLKPEALSSRKILTAFAK